MNTIKVNTKDFNHKLKSGARLLVCCDYTYEINRPETYNPEHVIELRYVNRDALKFWGFSVQSGSFMDFYHQQVRIKID